MKKWPMILSISTLLCCASCSSTSINGTTNYKNNVYYQVYQTYKMVDGKTTEAPDNTIYTFSLKAKDVSRKEEMTKASAITFNGEALTQYYFDYYSNESAEKVSVKEAGRVKVLSFGNNILVPDYLNTYYEKWYFTREPETYYIDNDKLLMRTEESDDCYKEYYYVTESYAKAKGINIVQIK